MVETPKKCRCLWRGEFSSHQTLAHISKLWKDDFAHLRRSPPRPVCFISAAPLRNPKPFEILGKWMWLCRSWGLLSCPSERLSSWQTRQEGDWSSPRSRLKRFKIHTETRRFWFIVNIGIANRVWNSLSSRSSAQHLRDRLIWSWFHKIVWLCGLDRQTCEVGVHQLLKA